MSLSWWLSMATALVAAGFAVILFQRFAIRPRPHLAIWGVGMVAYALGALGQAVLTVGWNELVFRLWYWCGAMLVAPLIGQGSLFLLARGGRVAWISLAVVAGLGLIGGGIVLATGVDPTRFHPGEDLTHQYREIFTGPTGLVAARQIVTILLNAYGTLLLVGGALFSAWQLWRHTGTAIRFGGLILIAIGGAFPALGGSLILLGRPEFKYAAELVGAICLFVGFALATAAPRPVTLARAVRET